MMSKHRTRSQRPAARAHAHAVEESQPQGFIALTPGANA